MSLQIPIQISESKIERPAIECYTVKKYRFYRGFSRFYTIYLRKIRVNDRKYLITAMPRSAMLFYGDSTRLSIICSRSTIVLVCQKHSSRTTLECPSIKLQNNYLKVSYPLVASTNVAH